MLCPSCKNEVSPSKFCSNCGAALAKMEIKLRAEITNEWIKEIYNALGYETSNITPGEHGASTFTTKHNENPNLTVEYRPALRVLLVTSNWSIKAPGLIDRGEFLKTLNYMNLQTISCQCSVPEKTMDTLFVQMTLFLTDSISRLDVIAFNEFATSITRRVIGDQRVQKVMT